MRIVIPSTAFPDAAALLARRLPDDEVVVEPDGTAGSCDVIVPLMTRIDAGLMDRLSPRLIQQFGVGLEGVDRGAARERAIPVANVPAAGTGNSEGVGEIAVLHLLALARRYARGGEVVSAGRLGEPLGVSLLGARIVVLGVGDVGAAVVRRLNGFGCELVGVGTRTGDEAARLVADLGLAEYRPVAELRDAVVGARALIVCCTLTSQTQGLVGAGVLEALGPEGLLVNVARGPVVDYAALLDALGAGRLAGAGLDVYWQEPIDPDDPLLTQNVTVTPHVGGVTHVAYDAIADGVVANIERLRRGEPVVEAR